MATPNPDLTTAINAFKNAIYGEEVRNGLVDVANAVKNAIIEQMVDIDSSLTESGAGADAKTVGDKALLHRPSLTAEDDVDTIVSPGMWTVTSGALPQNWPFTSYAGRLVVFGGPWATEGAATCVQLAFSGGGGCKYRYKTTTAWQDWKKISTDSDIDTVNATINTMDGKALLHRPSLTAEDDVDTIVSPGMWTVTSGALPQNWPFTSYAGRLVVFGGPWATEGAATCVQLAFSGGGGCKYRYKASNHWGAWHAVCTDIDVDAINATIDTMDEKSLIYRKSLTSEDDIDTIFFPGMWGKVSDGNDAEYAAIAANANDYDTTVSYAVGDHCKHFDGTYDLYYECLSPTNGDWDASKWEEVQSSYHPTNWPKDLTGAGRLICFATRNTSAIAIQVLFSGNSSQCRYRYKASSGWLAWKSVVKDSDLVNDAIEQLGTTYCGRTSHVNGMTNSPADINSMLSVARSYYDQRYTVDPETGKRCLQYGGSAAGKISCSIYLRQVMKGITFADSVYAPASGFDPEEDSHIPGDEETEPDVDPDSEDDAPYDSSVGNYEWVVYPERSYLPLYYGDTPYVYPRGLRYVQTASMIANWLVIQGLRLTRANDLSNLEPGDIVFYAARELTDSSSWADPEVPEYKFANDDGRYYYINHIALISEKIALADARNRIIAAHNDGKYIDDFYDDSGTFVYSDGYTGEDPLEGYPYPYVHFTLEVIQDKDPTLSNRPYCVHRKWIERGWKDKLVLDAADAGEIEAYNSLTNYEAGDLCGYKGLVYRCKDRISGGAWNANDWVCINTEAWCGNVNDPIPNTVPLPRNNLNTMPIICRPDLGHMSSDLEARVAALEEALANLQA